MNNVDSFNLIVRQISRRGFRCFPLPLEVKLEDFYIDGDVRTWAAVFKHTLLWLQDNEYIKISPSISDKENAFSITFTEKSVAKWYEPRSSKDISVVRLVSEPPKKILDLLFMKRIKRSELILTAIR